MVASLMGELISLAVARVISFWFDGSGGDSGGGGGGGGGGSGGGGFVGVGISRIGVGVGRDGDSGGGGYVRVGGGGGGVGAVGVLVLALAAVLRTRLCWRVLFRRFTFIYLERSAGGGWKDLRIHRLFFISKVVALSLTIHPFSPSLLSTLSL